MRSPESISYKRLNNYLKAAIIGYLTPILYFDTNVFLDIIDSRGRNSIDLYNYAHKNKWQCITSIFAKVEVLEVKQIERFKKEKQSACWSNKRIKNELHKRNLCSSILGNISRSVTLCLKYRCADFRPYSCLAEEGWVKAEEVKRKTNLTDKDSIHLAEALAIACDLFVTRDESLLTIAKKYIWAESPDSLINILRSLGAQI